MVAALFALLACLHIAEAVCAGVGWPSLGYRVQEWARRNRWFTLILLTLVAMLLAHLALHDVPTP